MNFRIVLALSGAFAALPLLVPASAQVPPGRPPAFTRCAACHATAAGKPSPVGPNLFGISGRVSGTLPGFRYSDAMKKAAIHWDEASLDNYIMAPKKAVPGTMMIETPEPDPDKRKAIVDYLLTLK